MSTLLFEQSVGIHENSSSTVDFACLNTFADFFTILLWARGFPLKKKSHVTSGIFGIGMKMFWIFCLMFLGL